VASLYFWLNQDLPQLPNNLQQINLSLPTEIYSSDGERIKILGERHPIALEDISPFFTKAITAVEDSRFYRHSGIDHKGLVRALWTNLRKKRIAQGGSTITQQLARNMFETSVDARIRSGWGVVVRKIKELQVAFALERAYTKDQILEAYINEINYAHGWYGIQTASRNYFGKNATGLNPAEAALLAGIINLRDPAPLKKPLQPKWAHAAAYDSWSPMSNHVPV
jgi:penicillin-binding protein 1A